MHWSVAGELLMVASKFSSSLVRSFASSLVGFFVRSLVRFDQREIVRWMNCCVLAQRIVVVVVNVR